MSLGFRHFEDELLHGKLPESVRNDDKPLSKYAVNTFVNSKAESSEYDKLHNEVMNILKSNYSHDQWHLLDVKRYYPYYDKMSDDTARVYRAFLYYCCNNINKKRIGLIGLSGGKKFEDDAENGDTRVDKVLNVGFDIKGLYEDFQSKDGLDSISIDEVNGIIKETTKDLPYKLDEEGFEEEKGDEFRSLLAEYLAIYRFGMNVRKVMRYNDDDVKTRPSIKRMKHELDNLKVSDVLYSDLTMFMRDYVYPFAPQDSSRPYYESNNISTGYQEDKENYNPVSVSMSRTSTTFSENKTEESTTTETNNTEFSNDVPKRTRRFIIPRKTSADIPDEDKVSESALSTAPVRNENITTYDHKLPGSAGGDMPDVGVTDTSKTMNYEDNMDPMDKYNQPKIFSQSSMEPVARQNMYKYRSLGSSEDDDTLTLPASKKTTQLPKRDTRRPIDTSAINKKLLENSKLRKSDAYSKPNDDKVAVEKREDFKNADLTEKPNNLDSVSAAPTCIQNKNMNTNICSAFGAREDPQNPSLTPKHSSDGLSTELDNHALGVNHSAESTKDSIAVQKNLLDDFELRMLRKEIELKNAYIKNLQQQLVDVTMKKIRLEAALATHESSEEQ